MNAIFDGYNHHYHIYEEVEIKRSCAKSYKDCQQAQSSDNQTQQTN